MTVTTLYILMWLAASDGRAALVPISEHTSQETCTQAAAQELTRVSAGQTRTVMCVMAARASRG